MKNEDFVVGQKVYILDHSRYHDDYFMRLETEVIKVGHSYIYTTGNRKFNKNSLKEIDGSSYPYALLFPTLEAYEHHIECSKIVTKLLKRRKYDWEKLSYEQLTQINAIIEGRF